MIGDSLLAYAPVLFHFDMFYVFGGDSNVGKSKMIGRLDPSTTKWSKAGDMIKARHAHGVLFNGDVFIIAGGSSNPVTEHCFIDRAGLITCFEQTPTLEQFSYYPEMYIVDSDYCGL